MDKPAPAIPLRCPACQTALPPRARFCTNCGRALNLPPAPVAVRNPTGIPFTPPPVLPQSPPLFTPLQGDSSRARMQSPPRNALLEQQQTRPEGKGRVGNETGGESKDEEGLRATFRRKRIDRKTLSRPLRALLVVTLIQTGLVTLLLITQYLPQAQINSGIFTETGSQYLVPLVTSLVVAISFAVSGWFALAGALRVHWSIGFLVVALVTGILAITPVTFLKFNAGPTVVGPYATEVWLRWAQLGVLALFWLWELGICLFRWYEQRKYPEKQDIRSWHGWAFSGVLALLLVYYGLECGVWLVFAQAGLAASGTTFLLDSLGLQTLYLPPFLVLLTLLSSTDLLEWGQIAGRSFLRAAAKRVRFSGLLLVLTLLVAGGMSVNELRQTNSGFIPGLVVVVVLAGIVALLVRFARVDSNWPREIPALAVLIGAIYIFADTTLLLNATYPIATSQGLAPQVANQLSAWLGIPLSLGVLTVALFLLVRGRMGKPGQGSLGLFLVLLVLLVFVAQVPSTLVTLHISVPQKSNILGAIVVCAAAGTFIWMIRLLVRQRSWRTLAEATQPLSIVFFLLIGLQIVEWVYGLFQVIATLGKLSLVLLAMLFLVTTLWSFITSGEQITNSSSDAFPREGRLLLSMGATLVTSALALYFGTLHAPITGGGAADYLTNDLTNSSGIVLLGLPLVLLAFVQSVRSRVPHATVAPSTASQVRRVSPNTIQFGMFGSGALVTALVVIFIFASALPQLVHINATSSDQSYQAEIPGPGCDIGGAVWAVAPDMPISTSCLRTGLQVQAKAQSIGTVEFTPPDGIVTQNYRVSVRVDLSHLSNGCVSINTRFTSAGYYLNSLCNESSADHSWGIARIGRTSTTLAAGSTGHAAIHTIEATADGPDQRIAIDGVEVGSVSDATFAQTLSINLGISNLNNSPVTAVFSDFVYTQLPLQSSTSAQTIYRASTPGAACDKGGAQWALMNPQEAKIACQSDGMQLAVQARQRGVLAFTPPGGLIPQNYQVATQVNLSTLADGCAVIEARVAWGEFYQYALCANSSWTMAFSNGHSTTLDSGWVTPAATYTLEATVAGSNLRFAINGVEVSSLANIARFATTLIDLSTYNSGNKTGTVVFSNFIFTPLLAPPAASSVAYQASIPGAACDDGGAQWPLMAYKEATIQCQSAGLQLNVAGLNLGVLGFTPPGGIFPQSYQISVRVRLGSVVSGCVGIEERAAEGNYYEFILCSSGIWTIGLEDNNVSTILATGKIAPATGYMLEGTAAGPQLRFAINGVEVGSASNSKLITTELIGMSFANTSHDPGTVVFSNFVFSPLP